MTELDFLLELLINHKLQKPTKTAILERIKIIQERPNAPAGAGSVRPSAVTAQAPSTQRILEANPDLTPAVVAQTPETVQALATRAAAIQRAAATGAFTGKPEPGMKGPKKW